MHNLFQQHFLEGWVHKFNYHEVDSGATKIIPNHVCLEVNPVLPMTKGGSLHLNMASLELPVFRSHNCNS